jgi:hypothetical protein
MKEPKSNTKLFKESNRFPEKEESLNTTKWPELNTFPEKRESLITTLLNIRPSTFPKYSRKDILNIFLKKRLLKELNTKLLKSKLSTNPLFNNLRLNINNPYNPPSSTSNNLLNPPSSTSNNLLNGSNLFNNPSSNKPPLNNKSNNQLPKLFNNPSPILISPNNPSNTLMPPGPTPTLPDQLSSLPKMLPRPPSLPTTLLSLILLLRKPLKKDSGISFSETSENLYFFWTIFEKKKNKTKTKKI